MLEIKVTADTFPSFYLLSTIPITFCESEWTFLELCQLKPFLRTLTDRLQHSIDLNAAVDQLQEYILEIEFMLLYKIIIILFDVSEAIFNYDSSCSWVITEQQYYRPKCTLLQMAQSSKFSWERYFPRPGR